MRSRKQRPSNRIAPKQVTTNDAREQHAGNGSAQSPIGDIPVPSSLPVDESLKPEIIVSLGNGLELWKVPIALLKEQDVNARYMSKQMFQRLSATIERDKRLESLPFCASTARGIEVVSGHHRVRAATAGGITETFAIVDVTGLTPDQIKAKQLAHNSLQGQDDEQLLAQIYRSIQDAESRLEAFIDKKYEVPEIPHVAIENLNIETDYRTVALVFMQTQEETFKRAADKLVSTYESLYLAELQQFELFRQIVHRMNAEYDIRQLATALTKMAEIVLDYLGEPPDPNIQRIPLRDIFGTSGIPVELAKQLDKVVSSKAKEQGLRPSDKWHILKELLGDTASKTSI